MPRPTIVERLADATIVAMACGVEHVAMVTGDASVSSVRAEEIAQFEAMRAEAFDREQVSYERHMVDDAKHSEKERVRHLQEKSDRYAEKRRVKLIARIGKQRVRQQGKEEKRRLAQEEKEAAKAKEEQQQALGLSGKGKKT